MVLPERPRLGFRSVSATVSEPAAQRGSASSDAPRGRAGAIEQAGEIRSTRLEAIRALGWFAVLGVHVLALALTQHTYPYRIMFGSGVLAQYLFFAMSGYLLYLPFARRQLAGGRKVDVGRYARNRMLRILPLYYVVIVVLLVVQPLDADRADWWRWLTFTQNYSADTVHRLNAPLWSVIVEMQFYISLPLMAWVIAKLAGRSFRRTAAILATGALVSGALRWHEVVHTDEPNITGLLGKYSLPSLLYAFLGGMLLAVVRLAWERRPPRFAGHGLAGASGAWIATGLALQLVLTYDFRYLEPFVAIGAGLILFGCVLPLRPGRIVKALEWHPLAVIGVASFASTCGTGRYCRRSAACISASCRGSRSDSPARPRTSRAWCSSGYRYASRSACSATG